MDASLDLNPGQGKEAQSDLLEEALTGESKTVAIYSFTAASP